MGLLPCEECWAKLSIHFEQQLLLTRMDMTLLSLDRYTISNAERDSVALAIGNWAALEEPQREQHAMLQSLVSCHAGINDEGWRLLCDKLSTNCASESLVSMT